MKIHHILAKADIDPIVVVKKALKQLKGSIGIVTTIQHLHKMKDVEKFLKLQGKKVKNYGQILGCKTPKKITEESILFIGDGMFHPKGLALKHDQDVVVANPFTNQTKIVTKKDVEKILKMKNGAILKFHVSRDIGVLMTTKSGQRIAQAKTNEIFKLKNKFPDKNFYFFACNTLNINELENFPFIQMWINTMCPRMGADDTIRFNRPVLNFEEIE